MAAAVIDRVWRSTAPEDIDRGLASLWSDLARRAPVARALMANLIVFCERPAGERPDLAAAIADVPIDEVSRRHPARVIVLHHTRGVSEHGGPRAAAIGVLTFGSEHARYGVEQISLRSACADASLPSVLRRLTLGDVPTSIWWTEDLSEAAPLDAVVGIGRQFLFDSRRCRDARRGLRAAAALLRGAHPPDVADLNWRRLAPIRRALLHALDVAGRAAIGTSTVRIHHRPGDAAMAWLLAGWLSSLGADLGGQRIQVDELRHGDEVVAVEIVAPGIVAEMNGHRVVIRCPSAPPFVVAVPRESTAEGVAAELRNLGPDSALHAALLAL